MPQVACTAMFAIPHQEGTDDATATVPGSLVEDIVRLEPSAAYTSIGFEAKMAAERHELAMIPRRSGLPICLSFRAFSALQYGAGVLQSANIGRHSRDMKVSLLAWFSSVLFPARLAHPR